MILILGGSSSGKSAFAEKLLLENDAKTKYYIATMKVFGEEGKERVRKHREMRKDKGFITLEKTNNVNELVEVMNKDEPASAMLECMSNLLANEKFDPKVDDGILITWVYLAVKICNDIDTLKLGVKDLIIVSNNVHEDGIIYDDSTMEYLRTLGEINGRLADMADVVFEVVAGIPIRLK